MSGYVQPGPLGQYSPEAHRVSDAVRLHIIGKAGENNQWCAIRLSDGDVSIHTFGGKKEAILKHEHDNRKCISPDACAYLKIPPDDFNPRAAEKWIKFNRQLYDAGMRLGDPDQGNREIVMPMRGQSVFRAPRSLYTPTLEDLGRILRK